IDRAGTAAIASGTGVGVNASGNATGNTIGGTTPAERNVISGLATGIVAATASNTIAGNFLGTDVTGAVLLPNALGIQVLGAGNTIGGTAGTTPGGPCTGACNLVVAGQSSVGIYASGGSANVIQGNFVGTDATGTERLAGPGSFGIQAVVAAGLI